MTPNIEGESAPLRGGSRAGHPSVKRAGRILLGASLTLAVNLIALALRAAVLPAPTAWRLERPIRLLVLAAHQDDCVIQAGGLAIQNRRLGGQVTVAYLTRPARLREFQQRMGEARSAWSLTGVSGDEIVTLGAVSRAPLSQARVDSMARAVAQTIDSIRPDIIVAPSPEGGHPEHDLLSIIVRNVMRSRQSIRVLYAAEYNPYYVAWLAPAKVIALTARLLPFVNVNEPNSGLDPRNQTRLAMNESELTLKREMLARFESQKDVVPMAQFGYPDLFDSTPTPSSLVIPIRRKAFSPWAVGTILLLVFVSAALGNYLTLRVANRYAPVLWIMVALVAAIGIGRGKRFFFENGAVPIGWCLGAITGLITRRPLRTWSDRRSK